jgi:hypothetical protein
MYTDKSGYMSANDMNPCSEGAKAMPPDYMMVLKLEQYNLQHMLYEMAWRPTWDIIIR